MVSKDTQHKNCSNKNCKKLNPQAISEFHKNNRSIDGFTYRCKSCIKEGNSSAADKIKSKNKRWKASNPNNRKNYELQRSYGINLEVYNKMLIAQDHKCAICNKHKDDLSQVLNVDHCHQTLKVRGLLCADCNRGLGIFQDDPDRLIKAAKYLRK